MSRFPRPILWGAAVHRTGFITRTRWWLPFCLVVDWTLAAILVVLLVAGVHIGG